MPGALPASLVADIDQVLIQRTAQLKKGLAPLRFIGATQDAKWRREAEKTVDAAFRMFLRPILSNPMMDTALVRQLLREVHLAGFRTSEQIPIKDFLDRFAGDGGQPAHIPQPA